jgi:hypothetical protein
LIFLQKYLAIKLAELNQQCYRKLLLGVQDLSV